MSSLTRARIAIRGAVQGVGFRPFVYRLAQELHLCGWVSNSMAGVSIEAEGAKESVDAFLIGLGREHPRHASIHSFEYSFVEPGGATNFQIRESEAIVCGRTLVLPDIATCRDCLDEVFDPANRRYRYPFTNCTNCGPRFTIIEKLPYDRGNTTMQRFPMCVKCRAEYEDPLDRRFHAQPIACPACGPQLEWRDAHGAAVTGREDALQRAVAALKDGRIVAVKGLGGFHLMVDAANDDAVQRLRRRKHREEKPLALMAPSIDAVRALCLVEPLEERALLAPESPIVLLRRRTDAVGIAASVAPDNPYLGVMLPYTPLHHLLMQDVGGPLVATSGNHSDEPIAIDEREAIERLGDIADGFLVHDRPIRRHADDSIVRVILGGEQVLRRARGYAPLPVTIGGSLPPTLATGGHLKNTVALAVDDCVFVSQHVGDLSTAEAAAAFRGVIADFSNLYDARPHTIAADAHPEYASTKYAESQAESLGASVIHVQHHWAHVLSCMADNSLAGPALGVAWDGTGFGADGSIWGGEFLLADARGFHRVAHLRTFALPGGDAAAKRPAHTAAGLLYEIFGASAFTGEEPPLLRQMLEKQVRSPRTSSAGRLFDAVASLAGVAREISFEGQAAMKLEFCAAAGIEDCYEHVLRNGAPIVIDWEPMIRQVLIDVERGVPAPVVSAKFHNALAEMIVAVARCAGEKRVALSGGCFQNRYLTERAVSRLRQAGFAAYWHQRVPPNDGGISLGQAMAAARGAVVPEEKSCVLQSRAKSLT